jgi:hypothetical protein
VTAVDVLGVPDVARVSDVAAFPTAVDVLQSATDVSNVSGLLTYLVLLASLLLPLLWLTSLLFKFCFHQFCGRRSNCCRTFCGKTLSLM